MSQIYKKILIVKRFGVKKIGENVTVKLNEVPTGLTPVPNRPHPQPLTLITQHPPLAITFCDICMPEAFCGFKTLRKKVLLNL